MKDYRYIPAQPNTWLLSKSADAESVTFSIDRLVAYRYEPSYEGEYSLQPVCISGDESYALTQTDAHLENDVVCIGSYPKCRKYAELEIAFLKSKESKLEIRLVIDETPEDYGYPMK